jgi:act minimal PKS acyl carrier protein
MREFTLEDLKRIVREGAGEDGTTLDGDLMDVPFADLGYDSLAMLETVSRISREFGTALPDDLAVEARTPRMMLDMVNGTIVSAPAV